MQNNYQRIIKLLVLPFVGAVGIGAGSNLSPGIKPIGLVTTESHSCESPQWWRGQTHAHANWGPPQLPWTSPDTVVRWYREHQFNFVAMTDLNYFTPVAGLKAVYDAPGRFIVIAGEEPSQEPLGVGVKIIDTIGIGIDGPVDLTTLSGTTTAEVWDSQAKAIRAVDGLPIAAHPNLTYAGNAQDLLNSDQTNGPRFFEVYNSEPGMNNLGGGDKISTEKMWDQVLSTGRVLYGVAADDSHHFSTLVESTIPNEALSNPSRAWIMVRSCELTWPSLRSAMERGDFYATTGIKLLDYKADSSGVRIWLDDHTRDLGWSVNGNNPELYTTMFIGQNGQVLKVDRSLTPSYTFTNHDLYVRAKIVSSDGYIAWTQPVFRH